MATSPLFGWEEPDDTDLVKDGAAAIRTLGNAIDTSMGDLLGGTTGQVLAKNSNTNMDFTWVAQDDSNAIQNAIVDAKGDLIAATAADTPARLAVGTNDSILTAASGESTGLKWSGLSTAFTPTWANLTVGNGTNTASYVQVGKIVTIVGKIVFGSTTSITGHPQFTLPITAKDTSGIPGLVEYADLGVAGWFGHMFLPSTTTVNFWTVNTAGTYPSWTSVSSTVPFTFGTNDFFMYRLTYEAA
jgi:hypothetical protein